MTETRMVCMFEAFPKNAQNKVLTEYGTSGFRSSADNIKPLCFSVGVLAALRSLSFNGATIGVVITASHNPPEDNGVKVVDPSGGMLAEKWEEYATDLSKPSTKEEFEVEFRKILNKTGIILGKNKPRVFTAIDTRKSSPELLESLVNGLKCLGTEHVHYGVQTTPFLHYMVMMANNPDPRGSMYTPSENLYYEQFSEAYMELLKIACGNIPKNDSLGIDCANGVGAILAKKMSAYIPQDTLRISIINDSIDDHSTLNSQCGADFVKTTLTPPKNHDKLQLKKMCSFDGDADRVVFWYLTDDQTLQLLDGDRIAVLMSEFISEHIKKSNLGDFKLGIVQTGYANRASTDYIKDTLKFPVSLACSGVKNLHHVAASMDVGIYFESNGHGTVLFSEKFMNAIEAAKGLNEEEAASIRILKAFCKVINQATGDAMCDALSVCAILTIKGWTLEQWSKRYTDVPNLLEKIKVKDKSIFKTENFDTTLVEPVFAKNFIEKSVLETPGGRCFVRPSGTENVIRVYAEANTENDVMCLMNKVCTFLKENFGSTS